MKPAVSLDGLLPPGLRLLASCFDAHHTNGGGLFDVGARVESLDRVSSSGLDATEGLLYRCLWSADGSPAELLVYDQVGVRRYHRLDDVSTPHDILVLGDEVLVAATMQNEVRCIGPDGGVSWRWTAPGEPDSWHLNSLARHGDRLVVCGFGPFLRRRGWDDNGKPSTGRVVTLDTGQVVLDGLCAPHNPVRVGDAWVVCDSATGELVEIPDATRAPARRVALPGWPRGLAMTDRHFFVGLSPHRHAASSVVTAAVAAVDRADLGLVAVVPLEAREVYALALVPDALADGARVGFGTNHTRVHEQEQMRLFERVGVRPSRLWAIGDPLPHEGCRVVITAPEPAAGGETVDAAPDSLLTVDCLVRNAGREILTPAPPHPVWVVHRWYDQDGGIVPSREIRAALPRSLPPEDAVTVPVRARVPAAPGRYRLRVTLEQDGGVPFDSLDDASALDLAVRVAAGATPEHAPLLRFGIRERDLVATRGASVTVGQQVRALLSPADSPGVVHGLIASHGREAFTRVLAAALGGSAAALRDVVDRSLPAPGEVVLTGAEAIAVALSLSGVRMAFGCGSGGALPEALARACTPVEAGSARDALHLAGGASLLRPGTAVAAVDADAALPDVLAALARLRRDATGTLVVTTGRNDPSAAEGAGGEFAALGALAADWFPAGRRTAPEAFVTALRDALTAAAARPAGPVLLAVERAAAETAWIPLSLVTAGIGRPPPTPPSPFAPAVPAIPPDASWRDQPAVHGAADGNGAGLSLVCAAAAELGAAGALVVVTDGRPAGCAPVAGQDGPPVVPGTAATAIGLALAEPAVSVWCWLPGGAAVSAALDPLALAARHDAPVTFLTSGPAPASAPEPLTLAAAVGIRTRRVEVPDSARPTDRSGFPKPAGLARALKEMAGHDGPALVALEMSPAVREGASDA